MYFFCVWRKLDNKIFVLLASTSPGRVSASWKGQKTSCPSCWKLLCSICNNSIRFFQCRGCFDIDMLSRFKCGYFLRLCLFPLCEKALLSSCQFQFPPTATTQTHSHPHIRTCTRTHTHSSYLCGVNGFKLTMSSPRLRHRKRNPGLMSQPPHLLQETKGLGVKCRLLHQPRGVERVDCRGGSSCEAWVDVYLLVSKGQRREKRTEGEEHRTDGWPVVE